MSSSRRLKLFGPLLTGLLVLLATPAVLADFAPGDWRYYKEVTLPALDEERLVELAPDAELFAGAEEPGLSGLRIIGGDGVEVPYALEVQRGKDETTRISAQVRDLGHVPGRYTSLVAGLGSEDFVHNEIEVRVSPEEENFRRTVTVQTSKDAETWATVAEGEIYAFTVEDRGFSTRETRVPYPDTTARYLRVRIADEGQGSLDVTGARVLVTEEVPPEEVEWPVQAGEQRRDDERRATVIDLDLGASGLPSSRLKLEVGDENFHRGVTVEASDDRETWRTAASRNDIWSYDTDLRRGRNTVEASDDRETWRTAASRNDIWSYDTDLRRGRNLEVPYEETFDRYLRVVIHDGDSPPLDVKAVHVRGIKRRVLFSAAPGGAYRAYYGSPEARKPVYDVARIYPFVETENLSRAGLGVQRENPEFVPEQPPVTDRFPWLLPAVVAVAAVVLAGLIVGVLRRASSALPPQGG